jgi:hypothetical protein
MYCQATEREAIETHDPSEAAALAMKSATACGCESIGRWLVARVSVVAFIRSAVLRSCCGEVVRCDHEPGWLGVPGSHLYRCPENRTLRGTLGCQHEFLSGGRKILGKILLNAFCSEKKVAVIDRFDLTINRGCRVTFRKAAAGLALIGSERCYINKSRHFGIGSGFSDDGAPVRVTNEKYRTVLRGNQSVR